MMMLLRLLLKLYFSHIFPGLNVVFRKLASHFKSSLEILVHDVDKIIVTSSFYFYISRVKCGIPEVSQSFQAQHGDPSR